MRPLASRLCRFGLAAALAACAFSALADALLDRANRLLEQRRAKEAFALLLPLEAERSGDPQYDYLLGVAALDGGDPERAVFALERVLAVQPEHHAARAAIARAYLALGERDAAKREFEAVRRQSIPEDARATIDKFLSAISAAETTQVTGFVEASAGYDTNINTATSSTQFAIPNPVGPTDGTRRADAFGGAAAGVSFAHRIAPAWALVGSAGAAGKMHRRKSDFDHLNLDGSLGARWHQGKDAVTVGTQLQYFELDYTGFRNLAGLVAQWQHSYSETRQATLFAQYSQLRYPTQHVRDADREVVGAGYGRVLNLPYAPVGFGSFYAGREREREASAPHMGHDLWGVRAGGQANLGDGWTAFANGAYEQRRYHGEDPIFLRTREDRQFDLGAGLTYLLAPKTTLIGQISHTDNHSSLEVNRYRRMLTTFAVRFAL